MVKYPKKERKNQNERYKNRKISTQLINILNRLNGIFVLPELQTLNPENLI